jgi:hypothetical protein
MFADSELGDKVFFWWQALSWLQLAIQDSLSDLADNMR